IEPLTRLRAHLRRVDQPVAAHKDIVVGLRQVRHQIAALIVGHDYAPKLRRQLGGLGDDPDTRFATLRAGGDTGDVLFADFDSAGIALLLRGAETDTPANNAAATAESTDSLFPIFMSSSLQAPASSYVFTNKRHPAVTDPPV